MNLLAGKSYDPAVAVSKATTALLAMTALDTTNLRLTFTVPAHGAVRVKLGGVLHGATTVPQVLLGVLEGATVRGRQTPMLGGGNIAATTHVRAEADFVVSGLTPGQVTWDAAYGVDVIVAATGLKYGGPNDTTTNNAFGAFTFEIYDPAPAGGGGGATAQQVWEYATRALTANPGVTAAQVRTEADAALAAVGVTSVVTGRVDAAVSTRSTYAGADTAGTTTLLSRITAGRAAAIDNLDATVSSRLASAAYAAPPSAAAIRAEVDANSTKLDATVSSRMATFTYTVPPTVAAIRTEMDTNSTKLDVPVSSVSGGDTSAIAANVTTLLTRLSEYRASMLDKLSNYRRPRC